MMLWKPENPVRSTIKKRFNVNNFLQDVAFDYIRGDVVFDSTGNLVMVSGVENFIQYVKKCVLTPQTEPFKYGFNHKLWKVESQKDFESECFSLATQMVSQEIPSPGLGASIEQITQIRRYEENHRQFLEIHLFATGVSNELIITIPKR